MDALGLASGALSTIGSLISSNHSSKVQARENEKNRQFNALEAQKARDFQLEMWNKANEYNDPSNVYKRLKEAGINPLGANGLNFDAAAMGSAPSASFSGGVMPNAPDWSGLMQGSLIDAQVRNLNSQSEKNDTERQLSEKELAWFDTVQSSQVAKLESGVQVDFANANLSSVNARKVVKEIDVLDQNLNNMRQEFENLRAQGRLTNAEAYGKELDNLIKDATKDDVISKIVAESHMTKEQAKYCTQSILLSMALQQAQISGEYAAVRELNARASQLESLAPYMKYQGMIWKKQNDNYNLVLEGQYWTNRNLQHGAYGQQISNDNAQKYGQTLDWQNAVGNPVQATCTVLGAIFGGVSAFKGTPFVPFTVGNSGSRANPVGFAL